MSVEIYCILDRSGSMTGLEKSTIDGFNDFVKRQVKEIKKATVTLVLFDDRYELVYDAKKLQKVPKLTEEVYYVRGLTALNDAVAKTLKAAKKRHRANGKPDKAICLIVTDGYENASTDYPGEEGRKKVRKMIERLQDKKDWDFFFIGSEIDAVATSSSMGIPATHATKTAGSSRGVAAAYAMAAGATAQSASGETVVSTQDLYDELLEEDEEDESWIAP